MAAESNKDLGLKTEWQSSPTKILDETLRVLQKAAPRTSHRLLPKTEENDLKMPTVNNKKKNITHSALHMGVSTPPPPSPFPTGPLF